MIGSLRASLLSFQAPRWKKFKDSAFAAYQKARAKPR